MKATTRCRSLPRRMKITFPRERRFCCHVFMRRFGREINSQNARTDILFRRLKMAIERIITFESIVQTLEFSILKNLHCSLSPKECGMLLKELNRSQTPVEKIIGGVADIAHNVIADLADDMTPPRRRRARKITKP